MTTTLEKLSQAWIPILEIPPQPRPLLEFARTLKVEARDPLTGEDRWQTFDPTADPMQREIFRAFLHGGDELVPIASVQSGKTFGAITVCMLYALIELRQSAGLMLPEQEKAEEVWLTKIVPVIKRSGYEWILPTDGRGAKSGAARFMTLNTGATVYLLGAGAKNESAQASFTCRFMFIDESSKIRPRWIDLAFMRTASYDAHARRTRTSTISDDIADTTVLAYEDSSHTELHFQCPHCVKSGHNSGGWQPFEFHRPATNGQPHKLFNRIYYDATDDDTVRATARLICLHDESHHITDDERRAALRNYRAVHRGQSVATDGTVIGTAIPNSRRGIRTTALASALKSLPKLAVDLHKSLIQRDQFNNHEPLRQFVRDQCVEGYLADRDDGNQPIVLRCTYLAARSAASTYALDKNNTIADGDSLHVAQLPPGVEFLTVGIDVNPGGNRAPGRLYFDLEGCNSDGRMWTLAWGSVAACPPGYEATEIQLHDAMERLNSLLRGIAQDYGLPLAKIGIDVGDRQDELRRWLVKNKEWTPMKDRDGSLVVETRYAINGSTVDKPESRQDLAGWLHWRWQKDGWWLAIVDVDEVRHQAQVGFLVPPNNPGAHHLPSGLVASETLLRHYCATGRIPDGKGGHRWAVKKEDRAHWPDFQSRRDYLACRTYALALAYQHRRQINKPKKPPIKYGQIKTF